MPFDGASPGTAIAVSSSRTLSFAEVKARSRALAHALYQAGCAAGDRVAAATADPVDFYLAAAACYLGGIALIPIDPTSGRTDLADILERTRPAVLIADDPVLERLGANRPSVVWRSGTSRHDAPKSPPGRRFFRRPAAPLPSLDALARTEADWEPPAFGDDLPAFIMCTSGTTSRSKATVQSRGALRAHVATLARVFGYDAGARFLNLLPTHHVDGLVHGVYASLLTGMTNVQPGLFTVDLDIAELLRRTGATHFVSNPHMLAIIRRSMGDRPDLFRTESFRMLASSAGTLDAGFWGEFQEFFGVRLNNFYGLTETISGSIYCGPADDTFRLGTLGKPLGARVRLVDAAGEEVAPGEAGELLIAGPHVMTGYLDDPEATAATLFDGWLATGDICVADADGFITMIGRSKTVVMRGGATIHPEDVGRVIAGMPGVRAVEVLGVPDAIFEEALVACVVAETGVTAAGIRAHCAAELSVERRPDRVELFDTLPLGPAGKVRRDTLIAMIAERRAAAAVPADPTDLTASILTLAADTFQVPKADLTLESGQETVDGWDSFSHMEFVMGLEQRFTIRLRAKEIMRLGSIGDAVEIVNARREAPIR